MKRKMLHKLTCLALSAFLLASGAGMLTHHVTNAAFSRQETAQTAEEDQDRSISLTDSRQTGQTTAETDASVSESSQTETSGSETEASETDASEAATEASETDVSEAEESESEKQQAEAVTVATDKDEEPVTEQSVLAVNPFYKDLTGSEELSELEESLQISAFAFERSLETFEDVPAAAAYVRRQMIERAEKITFQIPASLFSSHNNNLNALTTAIINGATAYSDSCSGQEGDALEWGYRSYGAQITGNSSGYQLTFTFLYHSTAEQERQLTEKVNTAMAGLNLGGKSDYEKVRAIHDYICEKVDYDYDENGNRPQKYSAYAALCEGKAVCQGYSILFYRMCKEAGLSVRIISGTANGGDHGWNIVRIGGNARSAGVYYNIDCTWDGQDSFTHHAYFLKCEKDFINHTRAEKYNTAEFHAAFPMAEQSYVLTAGMNAPNLTTDNKIYPFKNQANLNEDPPVFTTAKGRPMVLVFIQTTCSRSQATVQDLAKNNFSDVDLYVILPIDQDQNTVNSTFPNFISTCTAGSNHNIQFMYNGNKAWNAYFDLAKQYAGWSGSELTPTICYIDANNKVQHMTSGQQTANAIRNNITTYCSSASGETGNIPVSSYTITYILNGGSNDLGNPAAYMPGTTKINLRDPKREGYDFKGWYTDEALTRLKDHISDLDKGNLTLYAKWEKPEVVKPVVTYTITYVLNGGTNPSGNPVSYQSNTNTIRLSAPTRVNYAFKGWYADEALTMPVTEITNANTGNLTLYAGWEPNPDHPAGFPKADITLTEGNILMGVSGVYQTETAEKILERLNAIRLEACKEGVMDSYLKRKLTEADYVPLQWSSELEAITRLRAAEAAIRMDHTRPNGKDFYTARTTGKKFSNAENLAWTGSLMAGIELWYSEKADWVNGNKNKTTGHYENLISPIFKYVAVSAFRLPDGYQYPLSIAQEFSMSDEMDSQKSSHAGTVIQEMEVAAGAVSGLAFETQSSLRLERGSSCQPVLNVTAEFDSYPAFKIHRTYTGLVRAGGIWTSSDPSVATVNAAGTITAVGTGRTSIRVTVGKISAEIAVEVTGNNAALSAPPDSPTETETAPSTPTDPPAETAAAATGSGDTALPPVIPPVNPAANVRNRNTTRSDVPAQNEAGGPSVRGSDGKTGWDAIRSEEIMAKKGSAIIIDMKEATVVPGDILERLKGKEVTITFDMGNGITWSIDGESITADQIGDIDFSVQTGTDAIPADMVSSLAGDSYSLQISLAHDGDFGFTAKLSIGLGTENAGLTANLYYYNEASGKLEPVSTSEISENGFAELTFTHASDYAIVVSDKAAIEETSSDAPEETAEAAVESDEAAGLLPVEKTPSKTPWGMLAMAAGAILLIAAGAFFAIKRKDR